MENELNKYFDEYIFNETAMYFELKFKIDMLQKLRENSIKPMSTSTERNIKLNFSQIESELIEEGIKKIKDL